MIPKIIHTVWTSGDPFPEKFWKFRESWLRYNPDYDFMFWDKWKIGNLCERGNFLPVTTTILARQPHWEIIKDLCSWELLRLFGGIRVDIDVRCQRNFDYLLQYSSFIARSWNDNPFGDSVAGASRNNQLLTDLIETIRKSILNNWDKILAGDVARYTQHSGKEVFKLFHYILPKEAFYPFDWHHVEQRDHEFPDSYAVHYWGAIDEGGWPKIMKRPATQ
jgi:mannosyltransferase OCH1-like enzyme